jgi:hypothetical protein
MGSQVHWIDLPIAGRLAIMARPRAGDWLDDEILGWRAEGVDIVASLLEPEEISELDLRREEVLCREQGMEFISFPIPDRGVPPSFRETAALAQALAAKVGGGKSVAIHCRAGIGRSSLIAACVLVCSGFDAAEAFELIGKARGVSVPDTEGQRIWLTEFRDSMRAPHLVVISSGDSEKSRNR